MPRNHPRSLVITGAARGIGRCLAEAFARSGTDLVLTDIDEQALQEAATSLRRSGARVHSFRVDVTDREAVEHLARETDSLVGVPDVLVNNAGIGYSASLRHTPLETWERLLAVNLWGVLHHVHAFLPGMVRRGRGQIVNLSSGQAFFRMPTWGAYSSVKLAVACYSELLRHELAPLGIQVTTVYPFLAATGFYTGMKAENRMGRLALKMLPVFSNSPETVARATRRAILRGRARELVNPLNEVGRLLVAVPPAHDLFQRVLARMLTRPGSEP